MPYQAEKKDRRHRFKNVHGNYSERYRMKVKLYNDENLKDFDAYNAATEDIKKLIKVGLDEDLRIRACGSRWSLSKAPYADGMCIFTVNKKDKPDFKVKAFLNNKYLTTSSTQNEYLFAQCGNSIKDLNLYCVKARRSLPTSGASNGQTIAGAIGTGVNGSAINTGCVQDYVTGLHIVRGSGAGDSIFLEPKSSPVANDKFVKLINATLIRDDDLFYSALVGLGAFGYVHGVMLRTEPLFRLHNHIKKVDIKVAYDFTKNMTVKDTILAIPGFSDHELYHMKFYINQYDYKDNVRAEIIYKRPEAIGARFFGKLLGYLKDFTLILGKAAISIDDDLVPILINKFLPKDGESESGFLNDIFGDTKNLRAGQFACAIAVESKHAETLCQMMMDLFEQPNAKKIPSVFSFRFVKKSKAILAYTRYDMNCIIGIDGIQNKPTLKYQKFITDKLQGLGIPHTWHWGKVNFMDADFVKKMYGSSRDTWITKRKSFLTADIAKAFSSEYLEGLGLTG